MGENAAAASFAHSPAGRSDQNRSLKGEPMNTRRLAVLLIAAAALPACDETLGTGGGLSVEEAEALAETMIATSFDATGSVALADASVTSGDTELLLYANPITSHTEFTVTRSCVIDGQVVLEGTRDREWDRQTHSGSSDLSLTKTHEDCTRPLRRDGVTITLNGAPNVAVEAHHEWADGRRNGLQTMSLEGAVDWATSDDRSDTCVIDLHITFDPETRTRTVEGQVCNRTIEATTTWRRGDG